MKNKIDYKKLKNKAILLRKRGKSYSEIGKEINISKSTLSYWLKRILLKPEHRKKLYTRQVGILNKGAQSQKVRRQKEVDSIIQKAASEIKKPVSLDLYKLAGAFLYWGEGGKTKMLNITNSDPALILFMVRWLEKIYRILPQQLTARLNLYPQQDEVKIKNFWSKLTRIPLKNFGKSYIKPKSKGYRKNILYYGTFRLEVPKSVNLKHQIFGWIRAVLQDIEPRVKLIQNKWETKTNIDKAINL